MNALLRPSALPWVLALAAAAILAGAHVIEAFGMPPCELCLRQRIPYWVGAGLALVAGLTGLPRFKPSPIVPQLFLVAVAVTFLAGAGLAIQHIGVEEKWWASTCSAGAQSIEDMLGEIGEKPLVACDQRTVFLFGLTLADYNLAISLALAGLAASGPIRALRRSK